MIYKRQAGHHTAFGKSKVRKYISPPKISLIFTTFKFMKIEYGGKKPLHKV